MFSLIEEWQRSQLSQKQFCEQNYIAYHVFHYWYKRYRDKHTSTDNRPPAFVALQVQPSSFTPVAELLLPGGKRLLFHQMVSSDYLKALIG